MDEILVVNTGGTFNKIYDEISGELVVDTTNRAIWQIVEACRGNHRFVVEGLLFKDSLLMDDNDRELIAKTIKQSSASLVIVVHGTDTMDKTAKCVEALVEGKVVVFTGAMKPFSIDPVEATANFALALGFLNLAPRPGVYIAMHGLVQPHQEIFKDRKAGAFRRKSE